MARPKIQINLDTAGVGVALVDDKPLIGNYRVTVELVQGQPARTTIDQLLTPKRSSFGRSSFLSAATELLEDVVPSGPLGLGDIPIRELTAAQRLEAVEVAKVIGAGGEEVTLPDGSAKLDTAMYWAALIQMSVLDPDTCEWDGDTFVKGGAQLLTPEDIPDLAAHGKEVLSVLAQRVINLSWLGRGDLFRSRQALDGEQSATGADAAEPRNATNPERSTDGNHGAAVGARDVSDVGEPAADRE